MAPTPYLQTCWSETFEQENPFQFELNDIIATGAMGDKKAAVREAKTLVQNKNIPAKTGIKTCIFIVSATTNMQEAKHYRACAEKVLGFLKDRPHEGEMMVRDLWEDMVETYKAAEKRLG